jgi:homoaconitate hydratase family protein
MTLIEKILSKSSGRDVRPGDDASPKVDLAVVRDLGGSDVVTEYEKNFGSAPVWDPARVALTFDYQAPARASDVANSQRVCREFAKKQGIHRLFDVNSGIGQHVLLEHGLIRPGSVVVGTGSHMNLLGAAGCLATCVDTAGMAQVWHSGELSLKVPETVKVTFSGSYSFPTSSKDLALYFISRVGPDVAGGKALEFYGHAVDAFQIHDAITLASLVTEINGRIGFVPPNEQIVAFLKSRIGQQPDLLAAGADAAYANSVDLDVQGLPPQVACPHAPSNVKPVREVKGVRVDFAFIGSCTNGRFEDLALAAAVLKSAGKVHRSVQLIITPATIEVARKCLKSGYYEIFLDAGAIVTNPGCSLCTMGEQGLLGEGDILISSANRNFPDKLGRGAEIYLASPATVAASAVKGEITDPGEFLR